MSNQARFSGVCTSKPQSPCGGMTPLYHWGINSGVMPPHSKAPPAHQPGAVSEEMIGGVQCGRL
jgi:hypothetical protein